MEPTSFVRHRVIFLPGAGGDPAFWHPLGERLPAEWQKTYLGWPGLGNQPPDPNVKGFNDLVALTEAQLGNSPTDMVAQSMGGAVALRVALNHPDKIRRLVLVATSGGLDVVSLGAADWRAEYRAAFPNAASWIMETRPDFSRELPRLAHPTLLLWGDADPISPVAVGEKLRRILPSASLRIISGGDHGLAHDRAAEITELVVGHLR